MGNDKYDIFKAWASMGGSIGEFTTALNDLNYAVNSIQHTPEEVGEALKKMNDRLIQNEANCSYALSNIDSTIATRSDVEEMKLDIEQIKKDIEELKKLFNDTRPESNAEIVNPIENWHLDFSDLYDSYYDFIKNPFDNN